MAEQPDFYSILRVSRTASHREIRQSYRSLVFRLHPDHNPHPDAAEGFRLVQEAWEALGDPLQRSLYDQLLEQRGQPQRPAHRDPAYRRRGATATRRPAAPSAEKLLIIRLVPYATQMLRLGVLVSLVIAVDFFLPARTSEEVITGNYRTRQFHEFTTDQGHHFQAPYPANRPFMREPEITVSVSPVMRVLKSIDTRSGSFRLQNLPSVYANLVFVPIALLLVSVLGLIIRTGNEVRVNFGVVTLLVLFLNMIFFAMSVW
ncbi:MAG: J domain-containing protein [Bacteroidota bacterium]